jgi:GT2 family glycosyltransferase
LLRRTLAAIVRHLESGAEQHLRYEIAWLDNGSADRHALQQLLLRHAANVEKRVLLGANYGIAYGLNTLFYRACQAPYILTLEEDWQT